MFLKETLAAQDYDCCGRGILVVKSVRPQQLNFFLWYNKAHKKGGRMGKIHKFPFLFNVFYFGKYMFSAIEGTKISKRRPAIYINIKVT